ncbi:xanthine dehydrogenase-like [Lycorma delicatula]|uniref:xanthine dehydrogenase-like n=1 Tax=Lycorma delicatula TaxID=130591 RepID=UPI003F512669
MGSTKNNHSNLLSDNGVSFVINGKYFNVADVPATTSLNTFIREYGQLKGTKFMCLEGGCGACIVSATIRDPNTGKDRTMAVNSCLVPVYICHGWAITTIEHLGNRYDGYGPLQTRLAGNNGSQCGYCTPGMIMNMHSLLESKKLEGNENTKLTMKEVENSFGGNICRCTGYRPILDTFKSFCSDAPPSLVKKCTDIEDLLESCSKTCKNREDDLHESLQNYRSEFIELPYADSFFKISLEDNVNWYHVSTKREIFEILDGIDDNSYMIVHGDTAKGVYRPTRQLFHYIDVTGVPELHSRDVIDNSLKLGANVSLTDAMKFFYEVAKTKNTYFGYAKVLADHIDLVAHIPVRNTGSLAGNLSIKYQHREFPSDIFLILEMVGAQLMIENPTGTSNLVSLLEYIMNTDMNKKVITSIVLPPWNNSAYVFRSYKIMPRTQNAHAYVNAGFIFKIDKNDKCKVQEKPRIVFGGINPNFVHASRTEEMVVGKRLLDPNDLQQVLQVLSSELNPDHVLPDASPEFRKGLALSLFYKFVLSLSPNELKPRLRSGGEILVRPISSGQQDFQTDKKLWPLNQPVQKLEALRQCSGEAQYTGDIPNVNGELYGALVIAKKGTAASFTVDVKDAMAVPGVVAYYSAKDIPGRNTFMVVNQFPFVDDPIFAQEKILYAGQPLGIIIAKTQDIANSAVKKVRVQYSGISKPVVNFLDVIKSKDESRIIPGGKIEPTAQKKNTKFKVAGKFTIRGQYHYTMETQTCFCIPVEDGLDVYPSSQWPTMVQEIISSTLNIPQNKINVSVKRVGGAYGAKISRNNQVSAICALAAHLSRRPVHLNLDLVTNCEMVGKRFPCHIDYEVGVDENGVIQYMQTQLYQDSGLVPNEILIPATLNSFRNIYDFSTWSVNGFIVRTDTPSNTWCRAPNTTEGVASIENIMEHIAKVVNKDPVSVKLANINPEKNQPIPSMIEDLKQSSDYEKRLLDVKSFNQNNRWKKRGICLLPMNYPFLYESQFHALVSIYGNDGTVAISHGGVEIGQGINTKIAQVCAYLFGIPLEDVSVKRTMSIASANDSTTGGSITSEAVSYAVQQACKILLKRIEPIKQKMPQASWKEIIKKAYEEKIDLISTYMYKKEEPLQDYSIYGVAVTEVEIDILTGQHQIIRVDLLEDAGRSLSPSIDIGQLEGAFVMGLGYYTSEELIYDSNDGRLLTNRTWNYKPPGAKDIPVDFRIRLLKNVSNPVGVLGSKATGEPPLNLSVTVMIAIRNCLQSARIDAGSQENWFHLENPLTCERIWLNGMTDINQLKL